jgi:heme exporter protein D
MLGIEDKYVWLAYVLCIASALLCVGYSLVMRNRGQERVEQQDITWAAEEKKVEKEL